MFTGIVETTGVIDSLNYDKENLNLTVSSSISHDLRVDESLSHDGVCLKMQTFLVSFHLVADLIS